MTTMMNELKLEPIQIDGCAVGARSKSGEPILKPWRIAVSSQHMKQALGGLRCQRGHGHVPCAGSETARSAFYPEQLCNAIHDGLGAHASAHAVPATGTHVTLKHLRRWCQVACLSSESACVSAGSCIGAAGNSIGADSVTTCAGNRPSVSPRTTRFEPDSGIQPSVDVLGKLENKHKEASVPGTPLFGPDEEDPNREFFCRDHNSHELAQDDGESELRSSIASALTRCRARPVYMVARIIPISSPEAKGEECLKALFKETTKLRSRTVWDESLVEEWSAVRKQDPTASCERVIGTLGDKSAERHAPEGEHEYKARVVCEGNAIQTA